MIFRYAPVSLQVVVDGSSDVFSVATYKLVECRVCFGRGKVHLCHDVANGTGKATPSLVFA